MDVSARSYLTAGISLTAATAIAFTPLAIPATHPTVTIPNVISSDIQLTVSPSDIVAIIANLQASLDGSAGGVADVAGIPGQALIGVATTIETLFDVGFSGLIGATDDPTLAASLTILKTLSVDAYAMLAHNLGRINSEITGTTTEIGSLVTTALTGSLQNVLVAVVNVINDPLSLPSYVGLIAAGLASGQLLGGSGLAAIQRLGDAGFDIAGIASDELTFQFNNAVGGLSDLATQLGDVSGSVVEPTITDRSTAQASVLGSLDESPADEVMPTMSFMADNNLRVVADVENEDEVVEDDVVEDDVVADDVADDVVADDAEEPEPNEETKVDDDTAASERAANVQETPAKDEARDAESGDTSTDNDDTRSPATSD